MFMHRMCFELKLQHGVEENIWTQEGRGNGGMEETA